MKTAMKLFGFIASLFGSSSQAEHTAVPPSSPSAPTLFASTASETNSRAAAVLPMTGSEDAQRIRGSITFPEPDRHPQEHKDYLPEEATEWVVGVSFDPPVSITRDQVLTHFGPEWRNANGNPTIFGREQTGRWTFALAGDVNGPFSELKFAWPYFASWSDAGPPSIGDFEKWTASVTRISANFGSSTATPTQTPQQAAKRAVSLKALHDRFAHDSLIVLQAPDGARLDGLKIWDAMLSLGLRWGDMDLFHWENSSGRGDDHFFSVWTSTAPGYFLPERIAARETKVENLVFGFSIPRSNRPCEVAEAMIRSANYCQKRLGGVLLDQNGKPFDPAKFLQETQDTVAGLRQAGFEAGMSSALHLF